MGERCPSKDRQVCLGCSATNEGHILTTIQYNSLEVIVTGNIQLGDFDAIFKFSQAILEGTGVVVINTQKSNALGAFYIERKKA